jgi:nucleotide-binding universal stress UspA family protein
MHGPVTLRAKNPAPVGRKSRRATSGTTSKRAIRAEFFALAGLGFTGMRGPSQFYFFALPNHSAVRLRLAVRREMKSILVPIDFSDVTFKVVKAAVYLAKPFQSHIALMHVEWTEPGGEIIDFGAGPNLVPPPVRDEPEVAEARKKKLAELEEMVTSVGLTSTTIERQGPPVEEILALAESARVDLIVIGSHHHGALYHLFEGGVTEGILGRARCPVLIVPHNATTANGEF